MSDNWNEPLPLMDAAMCNRMIEKTNEYLTTIKWKNDGVACTLKDAVELAKVGKDIGLEDTMALRPTTRIFEDWMNWNAIVTYLFNRDTNYQSTLLSALRKSINRTQNYNI